MKSLISQFIFLYSDIIVGILLSLSVTGIVIMLISSRNLVSPKQQKRIMKLKLVYFNLSDNPKKNNSIKKFIQNLLISSGFENKYEAFLNITQSIFLTTFIASTLFSMILGFSMIGSLIFGSCMAIISPVLPIGVLYYVRSSRNAVLADELYIVMSHIVDAVESAGRTLQGAIENSMNAAPTLAPYLQQFLNTFLTTGIDEAAEEFRRSVNIPEVELFLDLLIHGFEHTSQELTRYFASEADSFHELEISARQRRMDRREVFFDVLMAFPAILGFALLIYPVFAKGVEAINNAL
ncbi:MAG: hypothetical protein AB7G87_01300 [Clostridia bacterium]